MTKSKDQGLTKKERLAGMTKLLKADHILCTGDNLIMETAQGPQVAAIFVRQKETPDDVHLATPTGVVLFECNEFHKVAQKRARSMFLENLDAVIAKKSVLIDIKSK
jgi:hypothetical protein